MAVEWDAPKTILSNAWAEAVKEYRVSIGDNSLSDEFNGDSLISLLEQVHESIARSTRDARKVKLLEKFASFAQWLDRYGRCIDTFVQASPEASIIWGSIRVILQFVVTRVNSLSKVVLVFTCILENFGRYELYQTLFAQDRNVQCVLALIYADIINFCAKTAAFYKAKGLRASIKRTVVNFESRYGSAVENFNRHRLLIEDTVRAAGHQRDHSASSDGKKQKIRKWLSPSTRDATYYESDHRAARTLRTPGTCGWLRKSKHFQQWLASSQQTILLTGPPGHGKTILVSDLIDNISIQVPEGKVVYFYCKYQDSDKRTSLSLIKSLLLQLLDMDVLDQQAWQQLARLNETSVQDSARSDEQLTKLCNVLWRILRTATQPILVLIDALNECEDWRVLLEEMKNHMDLKVSCATKFIMSCRVDPDILDAFSNAGVRAEFLTIQRQDTVRDMALYISTQTVSDRRMRTWPNLLKGLIREKLMAKADGMFLWTKLMIGQIASQPTLGDVEKALEDLPSDLPQTYLQILNGLQRNSYTQRILQWLCTSNRTLKAKELKLILEIDPSDTEYNFRRVILNSLTEILGASCGPLVEVQEDEVRFAHFTVKEFLLSESAAGTPFGVKAIEAHGEIVLTCLTYLSFSANPNYHDGIFCGLRDNRGTHHQMSADLHPHKIRRDVATNIDALSPNPTSYIAEVPFHDMLLNGYIKDRDAVLKLWYDTPNTALLDYAIRFLTHHLLWIAANGRLSVPVLEQLRKLLFGRQCLTFIESTILLMGTAGPLVSRLQLAESLAGLEIGPWISGARILLSEFDSFLRYYPGKIHSLPPEYFSADNPFHDMLRTGSNSAVCNTGNIHNIANVPDFGNVAMIDPSRSHFFTVNRHYIECRNLEDGLLLEEFSLDWDPSHDPKVARSFELIDIRMSKDSAYMAIHFEFKSPDLSRIVFEIHLLALHQSEGAIFSRLSWSKSTKVETYTFPQHDVTVPPYPLSGESKKISFTVDPDVFFGINSAINLKDGVKSALPFFLSECTSSIAFAESTSTIAMVIDGSRVSIATTSGEELSSISFRVGYLVIKAVSSCGRLVAFSKFTVDSGRNSTVRGQFFIYDWSEGRLEEVPLSSANGDLWQTSHTYVWDRYPTAFNSGATRLLVAYPLTTASSSTEIQLSVYELCSCVEEFSQGLPSHTTKWQRILAFELPILSPEYKRIAVAFSMIEDNFEQLLVMTPHEVQSWGLQGSVATRLTVERNDITPFSGLYSAKKMLLTDSPAVRTAFSTSQNIMAVLTKVRTTEENGSVKNDRTGQSASKQRWGSADGLSQNIEVHPEIQHFHHTYLLCIYDLRGGARLLHELDLSCAEEASTFAINDSGSQVVLGLILITITGKKSYEVCSLTDALELFRTEGFSEDTIGNGKPPQFIRIKDFQFHPHGGLLGFKYQNLKRRTIHLCIFDTELWRPVWTWSSWYLSSAPNYLIYAFHPKLPKVVWEVEGLRVVTCDFSTREAPKVLPFTCDQPFPHHPPLLVDFKLRSLAFSTCGQYLIYRDLRLAGVKVFSLSENTRIKSTDFLPKDDAWSYHCTFSSARAEKGDLIASVFITTAGPRGELFVSQRDLVRGRDRRVILAGLPKSLASKPSTSGTGCIVSEGGGQLQVMICKDYPAMQPVILSFTNVPWTAWEEISGNANPSSGGNRTVEVADAKLNAAGGNMYKALERGRKRLGRELHFYKIIMQDPKWMNTAKELTDDVDGFTQHHTYDGKGLPSSKLLDVIESRARNQWTPQVGVKFEYLWHWTIKVPGSEPVSGDWSGYVSQTSRQRVEGIMSGAEMTPPFFTWESWSGYRGTLNDFEAPEDEEQDAS